MRARTLTALWCLCAASGCGDGVSVPSPLAPGADDAMSEDTGLPDAEDVSRLPEDAQAPRDVTEDAPDVPEGEEVVEGDADPNVGTPCEVRGVEGVCLEVGDCVEEGGQPTPGFCPGPADIQCCTQAVEGMCDESVMVIPHRDLSEAPGDQGCLPGMARIEGFCIDRFECVLVEILDGGEERPWSPFFSPGLRRIKALSVEGAVPQGYISQQQAARACQEATKRLCTDDEWLRACQGASGTTFPYGDVRQDGLCNDARATHPAVEYFMSNDPEIFSRLSNPCLNQLPESLARAGANPGCVSEGGAFDMMGNLHEWTANPTGIFRGGFYVDTVRNGPGCLYRTTAHAPTYADYSTGFRCCR